MIYSLIKAYVIIGLINSFITVVALTIAFNDKKGFIEFCREFGYESNIITKDNLEFAENYYYRNWFSMLTVVIKAIIFWPKDIVGYIIRTKSRKQRRTTNEL